MKPATLQRRAAHKARLAELGIDPSEKPRAGRAKFHNVKAVYNGQTYDSSGEAEYARNLDLLVKSGKITDWERPAPIALEACLTCGAEPRQPCTGAKNKILAGFHKERPTYKPDFWICGTVEPVDTFAAIRPCVTGWYVDYKGSDITETPLWRLKIKLWRLHVPFELRVAYPDGGEKVVCTGQEAIRAKLGLG